MEVESLRAMPFIQELPTPAKLPAATRKIRKPGLKCLLVRFGMRDQAPVPYGDDRGKIVHAGRPCRIVLGLEKRDFREV